ncbi:MAG TPA: type II toxin-antitoxin system RelE/ParE family toxin [Pyrinomonadaceae bacterium]|nr:type II toxin-antitoxin system RelE/ParE family toxin [Pyrinomonadaceae bacterium]
MKVVWTDTAHNLRTIHDYIAQNSPAYAKRMVDRLTARSKQIGDFPLSRRVVPEFEVSQIREVFQRPYRIIYHIRPDHVAVIGVLHMSRRI